MLANPGDRLPQAVVQRHGGTPTGELANARVVGEQTVDLAGSRPNTIRRLLQSQGLAQNLAYTLREFADRDVRTGAEVELFTDGAGRRGNLQETGGGIGDIGEVAPRRKAAEDDFVTHERLADDRRDDCAI